jgi:hypothetical protein
MLPIVATGVTTVWSTVHGRGVGVKLDRMGGVDVPNMIDPVDSGEQADKKRAIEIRK